MDILKQIVGGHIREIRKRAGYRTIDDLAEALGVHPNSVGELERGASWISPDMLARLTKLFNRPPAAVFPGFDERLGGPAMEALLEKLDEQQILIRKLQAPVEIPHLSAMEGLRALFPALDDEQAGLLVDEIEATIERQNELAHPKSGLARKRK